MTLPDTSREIVELRDWEGRFELLPDMLLDTDADFETEGKADADEALLLLREILTDALPEVDTDTETVRLARDTEAELLAVRLPPTRDVDPDNERVRPVEKDADLDLLAVLDTEPDFESD